MEHNYYFSIKRLVIYLFILVNAALKAAGNDVLSDIRNKLENYYKLNPQQKVYIHTNKSDYYTGENIWLKAYVVNANNQPDTLSSNLYIELVNALNKQVDMYILKLNNGTAYGNLLVSDSLISGPYSLYAYTNNTKNNNVEYLFRTDIKITSSFYQVSKDDYKAYEHNNKKINKKKDETIIEFFPEGGSLISGLENRIAFKINNGLGKPVETEVKIFDGQNNLITTIKSDCLGIGTFDFIPKESTKYYGVIYNSDKNVVTVNLPEVAESGYLLKIDNSPENVKCVIKAKNVDENKKIYLIANPAGKARYMKSVQISGGSAELDINANELPVGMVNFILFNSDKQPVAERLVYINNFIPPVISISPFKKLDVGPDSVAWVIRTQDAGLNPMVSFLSVSIKENKTQAKENASNNIIACLLLQSGINTEIEKPGQFLVNVEGSQKVLDNLMLIQKWGRLNWDEVIAQKENVQENNIEKGLDISGQIFDLNKNQPASDVSINLNLVKDQLRDIYYTKSVSSGKFYFNNLNYYGDFIAKINAGAENSDINAKIKIDKYKSPAYSRELVEIIDLEKFEVIKPKKNFASSSGNGSVSAYGNPDYSYKFDETSSNYTNIYDVIKARLPGVSVSGSKIIVRGVNTFYGPTDPLIVVDGVFTDVSTLSSLDVRQIDRIDLYSGSSTAAFGSRGGNGVLCFYTVKNEIPRDKGYSFIFKGYNVPQKFYQSKNSPSDAENTIYWNPDIVTNVNGYAIIKLHKDKCKNILVNIQGISIDGKPISMNYNL